MAHYIIDIEVEKAVKADYLRLTSELAKSSFKEEKQNALQVSVPGNRRVFSKVAESGLVEVSTEFKKAAEVIGKKYSFFIVKKKPQQITAKNKSVAGNS